MNQLPGKPVTDFRDQRRFWRQGQVFSGQHSIRGINFLDKPICQFSSMKG